MANFGMHMAGGIVAGGVTLVLTAKLTSIPDPMLVLLLVCTSFIGALLPDIDSDSGTPLALLFGLLGILASGIALLSVLTTIPHPSWKMLIGVPFLVFAFVHGVLRWVFKKFTDHRGIFHSIPALIIAMLGTFLLTKELPISNEGRIILPFAIGFGFLSHLVLDEIFSATNLNGKHFGANHMLGSALKFKSKSTVATTLAYLTIGVLWSQSYGDLILLSKTHQDTILHILDFSQKKIPQP